MKSSKAIAAPELGVAAILRAKIEQKVFWRLGLSQEDAADLYRAQMTNNGPKMRR